MPCSFHSGPSSSQIFPMWEFSVISTLTVSGVTKTQSSRWQRIAAITDYAVVSDNRTIEKQLIPGRLTTVFRECREVRFSL